MKMDEQDKRLGKRIYFFRKKMHWPLKKLAGELAISIQQLHRYEKGTNRIPAAVLYAIAKTFHVELNFFYQELQPIPVKTLKKKYNVLIIEEENNEHKFFLQQALKDLRKPLEIFTTSSNYKALNFLDPINAPFFNAQFLPHIIFLDCYSSTVGFELLRNIKQNPVTQSIPVIVVENSLNPEEYVKIYKLHAAGILKKCFPYKKFRYKLRNIIHYWTAVVEGQELIL